MKPRNSQEEISGDHFDTEPCCVPEERSLYRPCHASHVPAQSIWNVHRRSQGSLSEILGEPASTTSRNWREEGGRKGGKDFSSQTRSSQGRWKTIECTRSFIPDVSAESAIYNAIHFAHLRLSPALYGPTRIVLKQDQKKLKKTFKKLKCGCANSPASASHPVAKQRITEEYTQALKTCSLGLKNMHISQPSWTPALPACCTCRKDGTTHLIQPASTRSKDGTGRSHTERGRVCGGVADPCLEFIALLFDYLDTL